MSIDEITSLDPRIGTDDQSAIIIRLLFEGLMRVDQNGCLQHGVANSYSISKDQTSYTFHLKKTLWSNGSPLVAYDFEYTWKKILTPEYQTPLAYAFYPIKNAKKVKEGKLPLNQVGIKAINEHTLFIELEKPTPYFLEWTTHTVYFPVNHLIDQVRPDWINQKGKAFVSNGPFKLKEKGSFPLYELTKNKNYWDEPRITIDIIELPQAKGNPLLEMYKKGEIDIVSNPASIPRKTLSTIRKEVHCYKRPAISWCTFNSMRYPFNNKKIRAAFSHAITRKKILEKLPHGNRSAFSPVPSNSLLKDTPKFFLEENIKKAKRLFNEGLKELNLQKENFPIISMVCLNTPIQRELFNILSELWTSILEIRCEIETHNKWGDLFKRLSNGNFQIGGTCWVTWINDPFYTLNIFKNKNIELNFSNWENKEYKSLLDLAHQESSSIQKKAYLEAAEKILIESATVLPLFYQDGWFIKKEIVTTPNVKTPIFINGGFDFSHVTMNSPPLFN